MDPSDPIAALCRLIAEMRPGWSTDDVKAALFEPSVLRRPFAQIAAAAVLCAADPATEHPGRLRLAGPWWTRAGATPVPAGFAQAPLSEAELERLRESSRRGIAACREALQAKAATNG